MGAYLSKPNCDKESEDKEGDVLNYGASAMQGWRLAQEDAHSCLIDFDVDTNTSLFAVYDGHGGSEVAQYAAVHFPEFLKTVSAYSDGSLAVALENAFLGFDATLVTEDVKKQLKLLAASGEKAEEAGENDEETQNEATQLREEATLPIEELLERYGGAGLLVNQALANMKKGGIGKVLSPVIRAKPSLSAEEGSGGSTSESQDPTAESDSSGSEPCLSKKDQIAVNLVDSISNGFCKEDEAVAKTSTETVAKNDSSAVVNSADGASSSLQENGTASAADCDSVNAECSTAGEVHSRVLESGTSDAADCGEAGRSCVDDEPGPSCSAAEPAACSSSGASCSKEENEDSEEVTTDEDEDSEDDEQWNSDDADNDNDDDDDEEEDEEGEDDDDDDDECNEDEEEVGMSFGDEPGADSGCTAVVALLRDNQLYVANAGDSRCVLCRDGKAVNMSDDHKPEDPEEQDRIVKAGGRVTCDGRVNGGLNLSRAIGDHIYKQNKSVSDRDQMITALPDVRTMTLDVSDQFMVLACDGNWNVMSSQDVVDFVKQRLQSGVTQLSAICEEMFDFCLAPDTNGDGTGCDNMTCVVVVFKDLTSGAASRTSNKRKAETDVDTEDSEREPKRPREDVAT